MRHDNPHLVAAGPRRRATRSAVPARSVDTLVWAATLTVITWGVFGAPVAAQRDYVLFEADPVRPLAISADGSRLFACNTPDGRVEIFDVSGAAVTPIESVPVGLSPVAVAVAPDGLLWVVNHLSDSVSVVDVSTTPARIVHTLWVGDEPRDVVFAGSAGQPRAFITTAHRGQHSPYPTGEYDTPGIGRADVWVFDLAAVAAGSRAPETILTLFGDRPRALAVSPDGQTVYAAVFRSGNRTTVVPGTVVCPGDPTTPCEIGGVTYPGGLPLPTDNHAGVRGPHVGLIVRQDPDTGEWHDELQRDWSPAVRFELPDQDVFVIDAAADPPVSTGALSGVGTVLFNMVANPVSGRLYVSNTEAHNEVRFEGRGEYTAQFRPEGAPISVRGHLHESRITVIEPTAGAVTPRHLNPHIDYRATVVPASTRARSLAQPMGMAVSHDGATLFVAAFGSHEVAVLSTAALEAGTYTPALDPSGERVHLSGGGPTGVLLNPSGTRLFVATRFNNAVSVVDVASRQETAVVTMHSPEPAHIVDGRPFLYDARLSSSNGESSCGSCHVFGDMDDLAWDLGDPDGNVEISRNPVSEVGSRLPFHPLKGPMTTQSLRGMRDQGPLHWRGDRTGGATCGDPLDEIAAFMAFSGAFEGLLGRDEGPLPAEQMRAFTDFALALAYPPNPNRQLDNALRPDEARGRSTFFNVRIDRVATCNGCHVTERQSGFFGTDGRTSFENETQEFKVAHLRNLYQKVGMFGMALGDFIQGFPSPNMGPQVRGFGFLHDGAVDTVEHFLFANVFFFASDVQRDEVTAFMMAFDSNLAPIVGQQLTLTEESGADELQQLAWLREGAATEQARVGGGVEHECDLIATAVIAGERRGYVWDQPLGLWQSDRLAVRLGHDELLALIGADTAITFTCTPPGTGYRAAVDRDADFALDGDERDETTDAANAQDVPSQGLMPGSIPPIDLGPTPTSTCAVDAGMPVMDGGVADLGTVDAGRPRSPRSGCNALPGTNASSRMAWFGLCALLVGRASRRRARAAASSAHADREPRRIQ